MIELNLKKYRYTFSFPNHEFSGILFTKPDDMGIDFHDDLIIEIEGPTGKKYLIDLSKVYMIECEEVVNFADLPSEEK